MNLLLRHDNVVFQDQTVYTTGNAYIGCIFRRCMMVAVGLGNAAFERCNFEACAWHINVIVHDPQTCEGLQQLVNVARQCVPSAPATGLPPPSSPGPMN